MLQQTFFDAVAAGNIEAVSNLMISFPSLAHVEDSNQRSPIHVSALYSQPSIARLLLESNANVDARDSEGKGALHHAVVRSLKMVKTLVSYGANLNVVDNEGSTPLHLAIIQQTSVATQSIDFLLRKDANYGLLEAVSLGDLNTVQLLLAEGQDSVLQPHPANRLLQFAMCVGCHGTIKQRVKIIELLFEKGLNPSKLFLRELMSQSIPPPLLSTIQQRIE